MLLRNIAEYSFESEECQHGGEEGSGRSHKRFDTANYRNLKCRRQPWPMPVAKRRDHSRVSVGEAIGWFGAPLKTWVIRMAGKLSWGLMIELDASIPKRD
jgi:hypothetical protein